MRDMTKELAHLEELKPFINIPQGIMWDEIEVKFMEGAVSHTHEPSLRDMGLSRLLKEINDERIDLAIYVAELKRRQKK